MRARNFKEKCVRFKEVYFRTFLKTCSWKSRVRTSMLTDIVFLQTIWQYAACSAFRQTVFSRLNYHQPTTIITIKNIAQSRNGNAKLVSRTVRHANRSTLTAVLYAPARHAKRRPTAHCGSTFPTPTPIPDI